MAQPLSPFSPSLKSTVMTAASGGGTSWSPTNISGSVLFLNYTRIPTNSTNFRAVTNELAVRYGTNQVFYPEVTSRCTNSPLGFFFTGGGNHQSALTNATSGIVWDTTTDSMWVCLTPYQNPDANYDIVVGNSDASGNGLFLKRTASVNSFHCIASTDLNFGQGWSANVQYDIALYPSGGGGSTLNGWTNGVASATVGGNAASTGKNVWGLGDDADTDVTPFCYVKYLLVCTNYSFTSTDIANLHTYATTNAP